MKPDKSKILKRNIFQRLFGKCMTREPNDAGCWTYSDGEIRIDLRRASELAEAAGAIRLEGENLPERVLVIHGDDGQLRAFKNRCTHSGRRLDPVPGARTVQCCSMGKSTFDYNGKLLAGSAKDDVTTYPARTEDGTLIVTMK